MEPSLELVLEYLCWALCDPERRCSPILNSGFVSCKVKLIFSCFHKFFRQLFYFNCTSESCWSGSRLVSRVARLGADLLLGVETAMPDTRPPDMETELGRLEMSEGRLSSPSLLSPMVGNWPVEETLLAGGQHLEASHPGAVVGPLGQESMQSSVLEMDPVGSAPAVSTNSG